MSTVSSKKPWPSSAVVIVASKLGTENRSAMESVQHGTCRDCLAEVVYDGKTMRSAMALPSRMGRPVHFLCVECCVTYDVNSIDDLIDHRPKTSSVNE